jgi:drug/metabolite transporter (DMT)-like permease
MLAAASVLELPDMLRQHAAAHAQRAARAAAAAAPPSRLLAELASAAAVGPTRGFAVRDEESQLVESPLEIVRQHAPLFLLAAVLGVLVNVSTMLMIKRTGSVSLKLLAAARNALLVLYAVVVGGESTSATQLGGYFVCVVFFAVYVLHKAGGS